MPTSAKSLRLLLCSSLAAVSWLATAAETQFTLPPETARLKPGPGVELVNAQCFVCHSVDYISTQPRLSAPQWRAVVVKMQARYGAPIATNSVDALTEYLAQNYGSRPATNTPPAAK